MDRKSVFRRSPSLPVSPPRNTNGRRRRPSPPSSTTANRLSPPRPSRGTSMPLTIASTAPIAWSKSTFRRSYSHDLDDVVALLSAFSSGSSSTTSPHSVVTVPSGDSDEFPPPRQSDEKSNRTTSNAIPRGSMRKRLASGRGHSSTSPTSRDESLSFQRKKKQQKPGLLRFWRSRNALKRVAVIIFMLFVLSFSMAYLSARNGRTDRVPRRRLPPSATSPVPQERTESHYFFTISNIQSLIFSLADKAFSNSSSSTNNSITTTRKALRGSILRPGEAKPDFRRNTPGAPSCSLPLRPDEVEFTLVTQLSMNRLWMMEHHCERWNGSFSIAVYSADGSATQSAIQAELGKMGCAIDKVSIHIITGYSEEEYPVNVLRNVALSSVATSHVIYVDIDFWPSTDLRETLQYHVDGLANDAKTALVLPAFQLNRQCRGWRECPENNVPMMPRTKDDLLTLMIDKRQGNAFDPLNRGGHGSTRYRDWFDQDANKLMPIPCVNSNRYEPYLIFRYCDALPPFQEVFTGYGKNKMTWVMQLRREGYKLLQLGESYVVHYPHLDSKARMHWNGGKNGQQLRKPSRKDSYLTYKRGQIDQTFLDFRAWLEANVPDQTTVPKCTDAFNDDEKLWTVEA